METYEQAVKLALSAIKNALADLEGIMPEFEPWERKHPAWKTMRELRRAIFELELQKEGAK